MRRWIWITASAALGLALVGALSASSIAESRARAEAKERGLVLQMADFRLGWFEAELTNVDLRLEGVDQIDVHLDSIFVEFSLSSPRLRKVTLEGGTVTIEGSIDDVQTALKGWRERRPKGASPKPGQRSGRTDLVRSLQITWKGALGGDEKQVVSGLNAERSAAGLRLGADLVEFDSGDIQAQIAGALLRTKASGLQLSEAEMFGASEMRVIYNANLPPKGDGMNGSATPKLGTEKEAAPTDSEEEADSGLENRLEKNTERVKSLKRAIAFARDELVTRAPREAKVEKLWMTYVRGKEKLHVGPSSLETKKSGGDFIVNVAPKGATRGTPLSLQVILTTEKGPSAASVSVKGGPVALSTLGVVEGSFGLSGVEHTQVSGSIVAHLSQEASVIEGGGEAFIDGLALDSPRLAQSLVTFPKLALTGKGRMFVDGSHYQLDSAELRIGQTSVEGAFSMERGDDFVALEASAKAPLVSCQTLLDSAPRGLLGTAEAMRFAGTFSLEAGVKADTRSLSDMKVRWDFKNGCRVEAVPADLDPEQFRRVFRREVIGAGNFPMEVEFGPFTHNWVSWGEVSPYVEKALLVTEDGRFYRHGGFDDRAIESAIRDNVRQGRFVRGASTISMQLAKNLYLSRTKTLSRKFQEAALTLLLEQNFTKTELLELYVNVIEFGPGVYGIRAAAEHYFATLPSRLSPAQAFFLASILPAPTREHFEANGSLRDARREYVHRLLMISHARDALTDEELKAALSEELVLGRPDTLPPREEKENPNTPGPGRSQDPP